MLFQTVLSDAGEATIAIINDDGDVRLITSEHSNFDAIFDCVMRGEDPSAHLISDDDWFGTYLDSEDEDDLDTDNTDPDISGTVIENLSDTIARYRREGRDPSNLIKFMHRLAKNPSERSREQLFQWAAAKDLTIDNDGFVVGFKGVGNDLKSIKEGTASVNGEEVTGKIPNRPGDVLTMDRDKVEDDPTKGCSYGLHIGTYSYAKSWGSLLLKVRFDPADVVSVPLDSSFAKLRVCRYEVISIHDKDGNDLSDFEPEAVPVNVEETLEALSDEIPEGFMSRFLNRFRKTRTGQGGEV